MPAEEYKNWKTSPFYRHIISFASYSSSISVQEENFTLDVSFFSSSLVDPLSTFVCVEFLIPSNKNNGNSFIKIL